MSVLMRVHVCIGASMLIHEYACVSNEIILISSKKMLGTM